MGQLTAFRILRGAHEAEDYAADPVDVRDPTTNLVVGRAYPTRLFKPRPAGNNGGAWRPGDDVFYSEDDAAKKFHLDGIPDRVQLVGPAPAYVQRKYDEVTQFSGPRSRPATVPLGRAFPVSPPDQDVPGDPRDVSPDQRTGGGTAATAGGEGDGENLDELTVAQLRDVAEKEGADVSSHGRKDDIVKAIRANRRGK
jgi:hypothetical protein